MGRKERRPQCASKKITITGNLKNVKFAKWNGQENLEGKLPRKKKSDLGEKCGKVMAEPKELIGIT